MELKRRTLLQGAGMLGVVGALGLTGCTNTGGSSGSTSAASVGMQPLALDAKAWSYDADNDVYYQLGRYYVSQPAAADYETLGVFVPGKYLTGTKNSDGTYAATVNESGTVAGFTAKTAPIVLPVNTPGYAAQKPLTAYSYDSVSAYLKAGFVYVHAGLRGKDSQTDAYTGNAPWGVTDLKAAVRYLRYNTASIPGSKEAIFVFGHSGGGAQSAIAGASGDSELYTPYLNAIGAAMSDADGTTLSDAIAGAMCWCPITNLDDGNAAYEWNMGQFATSGTRASGTWTAAYSKNLAEAWGPYVNKLGLKDSSGTALTLEDSGTGTYLSGTYYDHLVTVLNTSLNNFLSDTTFPYTPSNSFQAGMGGGAAGGSGGPGGDASGAPSGAMPSGSMASGGPSGDASGGAPGGTSTQASTTYQTVAEYIAHLNEKSTWVSYHAATNKATVTSLEGFVTSQKSASKDVGAFDGPGRSATENVVFGLGTAGLHFSPVSKEVMAANEAAYAKLTNWKDDYASAQYTSDFAKTDSVGKDVAYRADAYNPLYYLNAFYDGHKTSTVAKHWRIRTGIMQGDTANTTEVNLALALANDGIDDVDFATVWGQGHTMAERTGDGATNFIAWVTKTVG